MTVPAERTAARWRIPSRTGFSVPRPLAAAPIYFWIGAIVLAPMVLLALYSLWNSEGGQIVHEWSLDNYSDVLGDETYRLLIVKTLYTAFGACALAALIAYPMAYFASFKLGKYRLLAVLLVVIPLWVSLLMRVFGWKIILGENGVINSGLEQLGLISEPLSALLYTRGSVVVTMMYVAIPFVFICAYTALERIPHSLIEASSDSGATPSQTFRQVVWPLSKQGAAMGFALASLVALGDYLTPSLVGGLDGTMVGSVIASQFGLAGNWSLGAAMAIVLLVVVAVLLVVLARVTRAKGVLESTAEERPRPQGRGPAWYAGRILFALPYAFLYAPLLAIAVFSFNDSPVQALPLEGFTTAWYSEMFESEEIMDALQRSLLVSGGAVAIAAVVGTAFALLLDSFRLRGGAAIQALLAVPVLLPGIVLGIALAILFRELQLDPGLRNVLIGHASFVTPVVMLIVYSRLKRMDPSYAQASMDLGANRFATFRHVVFPELRMALLGACLLGFTLSFDEIIITYFLTGNEPTLPVYVWNQLRFGFTPAINAIFVCIAVFSLLLLLIGMRLLRKAEIDALDPGAPQSALLPGAVAEG